MTELEFRRLMDVVPTLTALQRAALHQALDNVGDPPVVGPPADDTTAAAPVATSTAPTSAPTSSPFGGTDPIALIEAHFAASPACPHCRSARLGKWGTANRLRRYRCKDCGQTFNALTGTPLAQLHKRELWLEHGQALVDGIALRKVAARLAIDLTTAFHWRHRFMAASQGVKAQAVGGIVEADETYFLESMNGSPTPGRKPRSRGGKASKRGLSVEQIPVLIVRNRSAATTDRVLVDRSAKSIAAVLAPIVAKDAILVSDGAHAYSAFAEHEQIAHVRLIISAGQHVRGDYHIQNVNAYTSRLKGWMARFKGVSTAYLDSFLGWHRMIDRDGARLTAQSCLAAAQA